MFAATHWGFLVVILLAVLVTSSDAYAFIPQSQALSKVYKSISAKSSPTITMKIFDWKRRLADESEINDMDNYDLNPFTLKAAPGSRHRKKRKGRGISAGQGASCGFGMRGQKSRSGPNVRIGFEGGQTPLYRRLPKWPGRPMGPGHTRKIYNLIKLEELNEVPSGTTCNFEYLLEAKMVTKSKYRMHKVVVGRGEFTARGITVQAHAFTSNARMAIEAAGGTCQVLKPSNGAIISE